MIFEETTLKDAYIIRIEKHEDERGFFARAWCQKEFGARGLNTRLVQANIGFSVKKGTLRGMHYQMAPYEEAKLVRCIRGAVFDVMIDLRTDSPTYKKWFGMTLTDTEQTMLYVPEGFAHGYLTLADNTELFYQVSQFYTPGSEKGICWNDSAFNIQWPDTDGLIISDKDRNWPDFMA